MRYAPDPTYTFNSSQRRRASKDPEFGDTFITSALGPESGEGVLPLPPENIYVKNEFVVLQDQTVRLGGSNKSLGI
jgi:hypothetical protein